MQLLWAHVMLENINEWPGIKTYSCYLFGAASAIITIGFDMGQDAGCDAERAG